MVNTAMTNKNDSLTLYSSVTCQLGMFYK